MTQETIRVPNGILTLSHVDKTFMYEGKETFMEVHPYCGPTFYILDKDGCEVWLDADDDPKWNPVWKVYEDWYFETHGVRCPSHQNNEKLSPEFLIKENTVQQQDLWKLEYATILVSKCHFPLQSALDNADCMLENIEYDISKNTPTDCADEEISCMLQDC